MFPIGIGAHHQVWKDLVLWTLSERAEDTLIQEEGETTTTNGNELGSELYAGPSRSSIELVSEYRLDTSVVSV